MQTLPDTHPAPNAPPDAGRGIDRGFLVIMAAQFFSALADNALFIAAIVLLKEQHVPDWHQSMLLWWFTLSYVLLAPFAGSFADSMHKKNAMMLCNGIKLLGCLMMLAGLPTLLAYAVVGFGAAAYSPAKYGLITEYLPHDKLVVANAWIEGATIGAIILGVVLGGMLTGASMKAMLLSYAVPFSAAHTAIFILALTYLLAATFNAFIPRLNVWLKPFRGDPLIQIREFWQCCLLLWKDPQGQITLAVTTMLWGIGQVMRLVTINWVILWLGYTLTQATSLVGFFALGTALGAVVAGLCVSLRQTFRVLPMGFVMGATLLLMLVPVSFWNTLLGLSWTLGDLRLPSDLLVAVLLLVILGGMAGFFVVPLNAMLQHRGFMLMGAGHSIAVQNFNENIGILVMIGLHALVVKFYSGPPMADLPPNALNYFKDSVPPMSLIIIGLFALVSLLMFAILRRHRRNLAAGRVND